VPFWDISFCSYSRWNKLIANMQSIVPTFCLSFGRGCNLACHLQNLDDTSGGKMKRLGDLVFYTIIQADHTPEKKNGRWREYELTTTQYLILAALESPANDLVQVRKRTMLDKKTISSVVANLVSKGHIRYLPTPKDKRKSPVELTRKGREAMFRFSKEMSERDKSLLERVGDQTAQQQFMEILTKFVETCEAQRESRLCQNNG
jgi:DNA-binding MarR family transcriptional regulator